MYITGKTASQMPANHFDMAGTKKTSNDTYEQVCYIDDRTGPSSMLQYVQCGDLYGSSYEIIDDTQEVRLLSIALLMVIMICAQMPTCY